MEEDDLYDGYNDFNPSYNIDVIKYDYPNLFTCLLEIIMLLFNIEEFRL